MKVLLGLVGAAGLGAALARVAAERALASPPPWSLRTNVSGRSVPAVLGLCVTVAGTIPLTSSVAQVAGDGGWLRMTAAAFVVVTLLGTAGLWDDSRGDEAPRGFAGHLSARRLTGGVVKLVAGGVAGIACAAVLAPDDLGRAALIALAVPLAANLFNLLDRAPGRTGKVALLVAAPLLALGNETWALAAAGTFGALAALLPVDLAERGMLGDAGANPIGGLVGLGLAVSLDTAPLAAVVALLAALNAASERWSFSQVIDRTPLLRKLDSIGRK
ncbi:MAG TPA: hypothetical protein VHN37_04710 [Actinomycetota bacterium]|nr:hypothetical protein [Actinomycetota bacterium]